MLLLFWKEAAAEAAVATSADTYGGGLYDRQLELQEEDALILQVIEAFLKAE